MAKRDSNFNPTGGRRGLNRKRDGVADWASVDAAAIVRAIAAAALVQGALRFGYSRDGGAYAIGIYGDGEPYTEWIKPSEDVEEILAQIVELFEAIRDDQVIKQNGSKG